MKIAIVGTAPSGKHAPYDDKTWKIWGIGTREHYVTRADRWFELHRLEAEPQRWVDNWRKEIKAFSGDCELVMFYPEPDLGPKVIEYPRKRISEKFGTYFMTSSFAWMMALAIDSKPKEIALYGVDMECGGEYDHQRSGLRHFIEIARSLGIPVTRLTSSGILFEPTPYPFIQDDPLLEKLALRKELLEKHMNEKMHRLLINQLGLAEANALIESWEVPKTKPRLQDLKEKRKVLQRVITSIEKDISTTRGCQMEQEWLGGYLQPS